MGIVAQEGARPGRLRFAKVFAHSGDGAGDEDGDNAGQGRRHRQTAMEPIEIPQLIDEPPHVLLWSAEELAPLVLGLTIGMFMGSPMLLTAAGFGVTHLYRRFRDNRPDGLMLHFIYWLGLVPSKSRTIVNPYEREFLP